MAVSQKLELRQRAAPIITPRLRQAIRLLQLTNLELSAQVERELDRNPLLESVPTDSAPPEPEGGSLGAESESWQTLGEGQAAPSLTGQSDEAELPAWAEPTTPAPSRSDSWLERQQDRPADLSTHLMRQLGLLLETPDELRVGRHLIECLDERGYLAVDLEQAARELGVAPDSVEAVLERLQDCEPTGVFARSLAECLALQLAEADRLDAPMQRLLDNLEVLARGDKGRLARICKVDAKTLSSMLTVLRGLDPRPGLSFSLAREPVEPVVPDLILKSQAKGGWRVEMNPRTLPRVMVNRGYYDELVAMTRRKKDREYLSERLQEANWLIRAMVQRTATILTVTQAIVEHQEAFFRSGPAALRPLTLRQVAETVDMHESTISRVTSNKHLAAPQGLFPLRYFFSSSLRGAEGAAHAGAAVRHRIREVIAAERPGQVLSDEAIAQKLRHEGVEIARRTVAKYRESMRIPASSQRRRHLWNV